MKTNGIRILVTEPEYFTRESLQKMRRVGTVIAKRMTQAQLRREVRNVDALVVRIETKIDEKLLRRAKELQCVVSATTGLNHIDRDVLRRRRVPLFSLYGTHSISTAEHTLALLFSTARNIPDAHANLARGRWKRWKHIGIELHGKTLGIFGVGRIGREVAARARGLTLQTIAYDPYVTKREIATRNAKKVSWQTLLSKSDFISLHAPLTEETKGFFFKAGVQPDETPAYLHKYCERSNSGRTCLA